MDYLEYSKDYEIVKSKEFRNWIMALKPKDVRDTGILERTLYKIKLKIKQGKRLNPKTKIVKILIDSFKEHIKDIKD